MKVSRSTKCLRAVALAMAALSLSVTQPASAQTVIKVGSPTIKESVHEWMKTYKARVEKRLGKRVKVQLYPLSQLGTIPRMIEGVQLGTIEIAIVPPEFLVGIDKRFGVVSAPGVFDDLMHAYRTVQDPEFAKVYWKLGEKKGIHIAGMTCPADANYASRKPIRKLADFKGKKIRVFPSAMEREALRRLGASAAPMPLAEVLPGLQRGTIDGAKSGMVIFVAFKFQTTAKYVTRTNESAICPVIMFSKSWMARLPGEMRTALLEEVAANDAENQKFAMKFNAGTYKAWQKNGGVLITLSDAERAKMKALLATVGDKAVADDPGMKAMYDLMKRVAARRKGG